jgi:hypothetical protein
MIYKYFIMREFDDIETHSFLKSGFLLLKNKD